MGKSPLLQMNKAEDINRALVGLLILLSAFLVGYAQDPDSALKEFPVLKGP